MPFRRKDSLEAKAIPKVNPSDLSTVVSAHGEYTLLLSLPSTTCMTVVIIIIVIIKVVVHGEITAMVDQAIGDFWRTEKMGVLLSWKGSGVGDVGPVVGENRD